VTGTRLYPFKLAIIAMAAKERERDREGERDLMNDEQWSLTLFHSLSPLSLSLTL
jgi:hypothetical protein